MDESVFFYIIIVSLNAGEKLLRSAENVLTQSYSALRVIVEDGGSTDGSVKALENAFGADGRLHIRTEPDDGIYDAMNRAVRYAYALEKEKKRTCMCLFLNCGDLLYGQDVLRHAAQRITHLRNRMAIRAQAAPRAFSPELFYGDTFDRHAEQVVSAAPKMDEFALYRHLPCHQSCIYALDLIRREPYETRYKIRADYEQFLRLVCKRHVTPHYLEMTVADYEGGGFSETPENRKRSEEERAEIVEQYLPKRKIAKYDLYRALTLQPVREKIATNPKTAGVYQRIKKAVYDRKGKTL